LQPVFDMLRRRTQVRRGDGDREAGNRGFGIWQEVRCSEEERQKENNAAEETK